MQVDKKKPGCISLVSTPYFSVHITDISKVSLIMFPKSVIIIMLDIIVAGNESFMFVVPAAATVPAAASPQFPGTLPPPCATCIAAEAHRHPSAAFPRRPALA